MKEPHMKLFVAPTGVGKTHLTLDLIKEEYKNYFNFIVIICLTLSYNKTYRSQKWFWTDPNVIHIEKIGNLLAGSKTLFLIDDIIANEALDE